MITTPLSIRFSDCDMAGHIHNAVYLQYFESGRMNFFVSQLGKNWDWKKYGIILKKNTVVYHIPSYLEDKLRVEVSCSYIGDKSFTLAYKIYNDAELLKAEGESVLVCFDYEKEETIQIPNFFEEILKKHLLDIK